MKTGVNNLDFRVIYKDANGYQESDVCTLTLNAVAMEATKTNTASSGGFIIPIVVILVIIAIGAILYIRRRKRKV